MSEMHNSASLIAARPTHANSVERKKKAPCGHKFSDGQAIVKVSGADLSAMYPDKSYKYDAWICKTCAERKAYRVPLTSPAPKRNGKGWRGGRRGGHRDDSQQQQRDDSQQQQRDDSQRDDSQQQQRDDSQQQQRDDSQRDDSQQRDIPTAWQPWAALYALVISLIRDACEPIRATLDRFAETLNGNADAIKTLTRRVAGIEQDGGGSGGGTKIVIGDRVVWETKEVTHKVFQMVADCLLGRFGRREFVWLYGPAGTGKTSMADQIHRAFRPDAPFCDMISNRDMSAFDFYGSYLPVGEGGRFEYVPTPFVDACENGGVVFIDECTNIDPAVSNSLNMLLSHGTVALPQRPEKPRLTLHPDTLFLVADNTDGRGGNSMYQREAQDVAYIDRFTQVMVGYDAAIDRAACPDTLLRGMLLKIRKKVESAGIARVISPRVMSKALGRKLAGWSDREIIDNLVCATWNDNDKARALDGIEISTIRPEPQKPEAADAE